jgi:hypothetical protein
MAFAARAGQGASLLSSRPCAPIAEIVLRHGPVERHALAEYPKRIAKTGLRAGDLPPKRRRPEPAGQTMGSYYRCKFATWTAAVR